MRTIKTFAVLALCVTLPLWDVHASVPDIHGLMPDFKSLEIEQPSLPSNDDWTSVIYEEPVPAVVQPEIVDFLFPAPVEMPSLETSIEEMTSEELEAALTDELVAGQETGFWTRGRTIIGAFLLLASIGSIILLFAGLGGGSGSGSGGGSGGGGFNKGLPPAGGGGAGGGTTPFFTEGGDPPPSENPFGPPAGNCPDCKDDDKPVELFRSIPPTLPVNPEPSTLLLLGLGLLIPFLRRKDS